MTQDYITTVVETALAGKGIKANGVMREDCGMTEIDTNLANFDAMKDVVDGFNRDAGRKVLQICLLSRREGESTWTVDDDDVRYYDFDAAKTPEVYGYKDCNDVRVVAYEDLDDEEGFELEGAENFYNDEIGKADYIAAVRDKYAKIRGLMTPYNVVVFGNTELDFGKGWVINPRFPLDYTAGGYNYHLAMMICHEINDDEIAE